MTRRWRRLAQLDWRHRRALVVATCRLLEAYLIFKARPVEALFADLRDGGPRQPATHARQTTDPAVVAWAIPAAARHVPWRSDCLVQAIAAARWLRAEGLRPEFHLGVARAEEADSGAMVAHAWLSLDGIVVVGDNAQLASYAPILATEREKRA